MPIVLQPAKPAPSAPTKRIRMDGFAADGPYAEHFEILAYLHASTHEEASKAASTTKVPAQRGTPVEEEWSQSAYIAHLLGIQLKDWNLIAPPADMVPHITPKQYEQRTEERTATPDVRWWKFLPVNVAELPDGVKGWLVRQIQDCTGVIATRDIVVTNAQGTRLDFRKTHAGLGDGQADAAGGDPDVAHTE